LFRAKDFVKEQQTKILKNTRIVFKLLVYKARTQVTTLSLWTYVFTRERPEWKYKWKWLPINFVIMWGNAMTSGC
jgi:hypothetical protein